MNISISRVKAADARLYAGVIALAGVCGATLSGVAAAEDPASAPPQTVVSYGDLNLNSRLDDEILYGRIREAAHAVCQPLANQPPQLIYSECVNEAIARSVGQVDAPMLTTYVEDKTGQSPTVSAYATPRKPSQ